MAADPDHKGKGLGYIVCAAVVKRFLDVGYSEIFLKTDDFRLPAVKTYLKMGFVPHYTADDHKQRWENVKRQLY